MLVNREESALRELPNSQIGWISLAPQKVVPPLERSLLGHHIIGLYLNRTTG